MSLWSPSILQVSSCSLSRHKAVPCLPGRIQILLLEKPDPFIISNMRVPVFGPQDKAISRPLQRKMVAHEHMSPPGCFFLYLKSSWLLHSFLSWYLIDYCCYNSSLTDKISQIPQRSVLSALTCVEMPLMLSGSRLSFPRAEAWRSFAILFPGIWNRVSAFLKGWVRPESSPPLFC